jgi:sulfotransferase family protein
VIGEASVSYLWSETAAHNIAEKAPGARILIVLRNPADRAYSQYLHGRSVGMVQWSFREHIQANLADTQKIFGPSYPFLEMGMYFEQVTRYLRAFPQESVGVFIYEDFRDTPETFLSQVYGWLGVDETFRPELTRRELEMPVPRFAAVSNMLVRGGIWKSARSLVPKPLRRRLRRVVFRDRRSLRLDPADRAFLVDYYRHDILKLSSLLDRDLSGWLAV